MVLREAEGKEVGKGDRREGDGPPYSVQLPVSVLGCERRAPSRLEHRQAFRRGDVPQAPNEEGKRVLRAALAVRSELLNHDVTYTPFTALS